LEAALKLVTLSRDATVFVDGSNNPTSESSGVGLLDIAHALAADPKWVDVPDARLVVRSVPLSLLGVLGRFEPAMEHRLATLRSQLCEALPCHASYAQAEESCEILAEQLVRRFGLRDLREFGFTALPRGGLIVLGMLSYRLGLKRSQLESPDRPDIPRVVVDDCAITGLRFGEWLGRSASERVIFAHLYSHPDLRMAIEASEPRVQACVSAHDLVDHAPEWLGEDYPAWRAERLQRPGPRRYWVGQIERIAFAWSEPDYGFWNPVTQRVETAWRLLPPRLCLRNRGGVGVSTIPLQIQPEAAGPLRPAPHVLYGAVDGTVVVADVDTELNVTLKGAAADMWRAVLGHRSLEDALMALAEDYEVDAETLRHDLQSFVRELKSRRILEEGGDAGPAV
jgi:hypothetical protein